MHLTEKKKLKVVKCNKSLQKDIDIDIINFKLFNGRYIIYESNGIGKEYDGRDDTLIFEGGYLNGQRSGKGKEYYNNGKVRFESEYLNGLRNGKGKEYYNNGEIKFDGKYINDKELIGIRYNYYENINFKLNNDINGIGKEYDINGNLIFEGEYLNGKRNGKGKEYWDVINYYLKVNI